MYKVALIGCGQMGEAHISQIYYKDTIQITYVCDSDLEKARSFQKKYGALHAVTDYNECVTSGNADIVIIATYPSTHFEIIRKSIENGIHVLCEKPISATREEGRACAEYIKLHPECKVLFGYILRHNDTYKKVAQLIADGAIGSPVIFRMVQNHHTMDWDRYLSLINESSPLVDCGVHYVDVMQWFTRSRITRVHAIGVRTESDVPLDKYNYAFLTAQLADGSIGYYEVGWGNTISSDNLKEFCGPKGRIRLVYRKDRQTHQEEGDLIEFYRFPEKKYEIINVQSQRKPTGAQFDYLIQMIETGCEAIPSIDEVINSSEITMDADEQIISMLRSSPLQEPAANI